MRSSICGWKCEDSGPDWLPLCYQSGPVIIISLTIDDTLVLNRVRKSNVGASVPSSPLTRLSKFCCES